MNEFKINNFVINDQSNIDITALTNGNFVSVWQSNSQDGSGYGIYGRLLLTNGHFISSEFRVNSYNLHDQLNPRIKQISNIHFIVVWQSNSQDSSGYGIFGQKFFLNCSKFGAEYQINSQVNGDQEKPTIATIGNIYAVIWQSRNSQSSDNSGYGIFGQYYNASTNQKFGQQFRVNSNILLDQKNPFIIDIDNKFLVVWQSNTQDGSGFGIYAQIISNTFSYVNHNFKINDITYLDQSNPSISYISDSNLIAIWQSNSQNGLGYDIYGRYINPTNDLFGTTFKLNTHTSLDQTIPKSSCNHQQKCLIAWQSQSQDGSGFGIYATIINASNAGIELTTTTTTTLMSITTSTAPTTTTTTVAPSPLPTTTTTEMPTTKLAPDTTAVPTTLISPTAPVGVSPSSDAFNAQMDNSIFVICGVIMGEFLL